MSRGLVFGVSELRAPLLGRDSEMATLKRAADGARHDGVTRIATVLGTGGVGKTRLIHEFLSELRSSDTMPRVYRGSARDSRVSYGVFARVLRSRFGLVDGMDEEAAKAQLRSQVAAVLEDRKVGDVCYFLGQLMNLRFLDSPLTKAVADDPVQARLLRRAIIRSFIEADSAQGPVCLVFDDLHEADDDSVELLRYLMENLSGPSLLVCAARPDLLGEHEDWFEFGGDRHDRIELGPLSEERAADVMTALLKPCRGGPPDELVDAGVNLAGGNPGLLERMVRIFHDAGVLDESDALARDPVWDVHLDELSSVRLPLTVDDAVSARLAVLSQQDRLLLEHAAAMGSVFWLGGVVALQRANVATPELWDESAVGDRAAIEARLAALVERDYLLELPDSGLPGETEFVFKHNLEREKLSSLTTTSAARRYHQVLADWLVQQPHVGSNEEYVATLARHLEQAGATVDAGRAYLDAGDVARSQFAAKKASEYYARGLELLGDTDARRRMDALHNRGDVALMLGHTDAALSSFRAMLEIAFRIGARAKGGAAHNRIGRLFREIGNLTEAAPHLETALRLFRDAGDERGEAACHDDLGKLCWMRGEYDAALNQMKTALEMRKKIGDRRSIALSLNNIGLVWTDHGRASKAKDALEASLKLRREIDDPLGVVQSLNDLGQLARDQGDDRRALDLFREAHEEADRIGDRNRIAIVLTNMGETHTALGETSLAVEELTRAVAICEELGDRLHLAEAKRGLAKAHLALGELRKAREAIKKAVDLFGQVRSKAHLAVALRTLGEITAAGAWGGGHEGRAVDYFMRSIALCKEIGNELEVAKSYRAFAAYVTVSEHYKDNADIQREAEKLSGMADEIFARQSITSSAVPSSREGKPNE